MKNRSADELFEVSVFAGDDSAGLAGLLKGFFLKAGFPEHELVECVEDGQESLCVYLAGRRQALELTQKIAGWRLKNISCRMRRLFRKDWQDQWKKDFRPFALTSQLDIVPVWHKKTYKRNKRQPIFMETTMAFGTGLHETTRFMANLIEQSRGRFQTFCDIGTGSGVLSIVAGKLGARELTAIDIDPGSIQVAQANFLRNDCGLVVLECCDLKNFNPQKRFDFVAANLVTDDLIKMRRRILAFVNPGKYLAISGISLKNLSRIKRTFGALPLRCQRIIKGKFWAALLYKKHL